MENKKQLKSLLKNLKKSLVVNPDPLFKANARKRILETLSEEASSSVKYAPFVLPRQSLRLAFAMLSVLLVFIPTSTVLAAQKSLPNDLLYPIKSASEQLLINAAPLPSWKKELTLTFLQRRADEIKELEKKGNTKTASEAKIRYDKNLQEAKKAGYVADDKGQKTIRNDKPSVDENSTKKDDQLPKEMQNQPIEPKQQNDKDKKDNPSDKSDADKNSPASESNNEEHAPEKEKSSSKPK